MQRLSYTTPNDLNKLHAELMELPSLAGTYLDDDGFEVPKLRVEGLGEDIRITVPDDIVTATIDAVVAAHDPTPIEPPPSDAAMIGEMIGSIEFGGNEASEELAAVMTALTSVLQARGF